MTQPHLHGYNNVLERKVKRLQAISIGYGVCAILAGISMGWNAYDLSHLEKQAILNKATCRQAFNDYNERIIRLEDQTDKLATHAVNTGRILLDR